VSVLKGGDSGSLEAFLAYKEETAIPSGRLQRAT
jgi:hypothetical protein